MKKLILFGLALTLFTACKKKESKVEEIVEIVEIETVSNVDIITGIYTAFGTGDIDAVLAVLADDIVWMEAENFPYADNNPYVGPQAVLEGVFARVGGEWDNFSVVDIQVLDMANDMVLVTGRYQGTNKATGKSVDAQVVHHYTLKDGKAIKFQQYTDTKQFADAIAE